MEGLDLSLHRKNTSASTTGTRFALEAESAIARSHWGWDQMYRAYSPSIFPTLESIARNTLLVELTLKKLVFERIENLLTKTRTLAELTVTESGSETL